VNDPKRSIWCNADAAPEACLFNYFLNDAGSFRLFDNLVKFGLSSRDRPFGSATATRTVLNAPGTIFAPG
jgi:hypothetical protein